MIDNGLIFRDAREDDLAAVVRLLADDDLGQTRERDEDPLPESYRAAFRAIEADPNNRLVVVERDGEVMGCLQLAFLPNISFQGGWRLQIEGVRIDRRLRGHGVGERVFAWAIEQGRARGCRMAQLTSNRARPDAIRFYERLGFVHSHAGIKLDL
jgi:GNAT superfamily N-acetyltransferase